MSTSETDTMASVARDFLQALADEGSTITWEQRQVVGTDKNGNPIVQWNPTSIKVIIRGVDPMEVRLTEPGFVMEQYLTIQYDPVVNIAILDRIEYQGNEYEVRAFLPQTAAQTLIFQRARIRQLNVPIPPAGG
jgi:hypothetical protein